MGRDGLTLLNRGDGIPSVHAIMGTFLAENKYEVSSRLPDSIKLPHTTDYIASNLIQSDAIFLTN